MSDIDFGQLSEALNDKSDRDLRNVDTTAKADAVIDYQEPTSANGYTWYRKYKSGWVEQGGETAKRTSDSTQTVTLPVSMANSNYSVVATSNSTATGSDVAIHVIERTTTTLKVYDWNGRSTIWQVSGMAAN